MSCRAFRRFAESDKFQSSLRFIVAVFLCLTISRAAERPFRFAILGDRTGEAVPGVYEQVWREVSADHPDFVINVGDTIQGGDDQTVTTEWTHIRELLRPFRAYRFFYTPGNHDIWSSLSLHAYQTFTGRPPHYSFDYQDAHFTVLDNSRTEDLGPEEIDFLRSDLSVHAAKSLKFVIFHRPSWIVNLLLQNPNFPLHQLAKKYHVQYVICGHLHEMLHFEMDGVTYLSMPSAGGHLRGPKTYDKGWFFAHSLVTVNGSTVEFRIQELGPPFGQSRTTKLSDWGVTGLAKQ